MDQYFTIERPTKAEYSEKGSKFIAFGFPIENISQFKQYLNGLKKEHPKATHHCFAYRLGTDGNLFRSSDDGEPSGTAGKPILGQIDQKNLTNILIVVVRYYGGTMLGIPGLINAYRSVASMCLQLTPVITKQVEVTFDLKFDYNLLDQVLLIARQHNCRIIEQEISLFSEIKIAIPKQNLDMILQKLKIIPNLEIMNA